MGYWAKVWLRILKKTIDTTVAKLIMEYIEDEVDVLYYDENSKFIDFRFDTSGYTRIVEFGKTIEKHLTSKTYGSFGLSIVGEDKQSVDNFGDLHAMGMMVEFGTDYPVMIEDFDDLDEFKEEIKQKIKDLKEINKPNRIQKEQLKQNKLLLTEIIEYQEEIEDGSAEELDKFHLYTCAKMFKKYIEE
jgi:hypothetical protein